MKKYQYGIIGSFALGRDVFGGQTIKTRNFTDELEKAVGEGRVLRIDTRNWKKNPLRLIIGILRALKESERIVILPADRGVLAIPHIVWFMRGFRKTKLQYVVIGGWLPEFLEKRRCLSNTLKKYNGIYVETNAMKRNLEQQGFCNVVLLPNFKKLDVLSEKELVYAEKEPYRLCTFSRVLREKGIEDAVSAVKKVNDVLGKEAYVLDIFGRVDPNYEKDFNELSKEFPNYIRYQGVVDNAKSTQIIKEYFAFLFPTYFYGEGYPGSLLDAFSAGVPVIASDWRYNAEIVGNDKGFLHEPQNVDSLAEILLSLYEHPEKLNEKKLVCLEYANSMKPEKVIRLFCER